MPPLYLSVEVKQPRTLPGSPGLNDEEIEQSGRRNNKKGRVLESVIWRPMRGVDQPQQQQQNSNKRLQDSTTTITSTSLLKQQQTTAVNMDQSEQIMYDDKKYKRKKESFAFPKQKINPRFEVNMNRYKAEYQFVKEQLRNMEEKISRANEEQQQEDSLLEDGDTTNIPYAVLEDYRIIDELDRAPAVPPLPSVCIPSTKRAQSAQLNRPKSVVSSNVTNNAQQAQRVRPQQKFDRGVHRDQVYENLHDVSTFGSLTRSVNISRPQLFYSKQKRATSAGTVRRPSTSTTTTTGSEEIGQSHSTTAAENGRRIDTRSSFSGWRSAFHDSLKSPLIQAHSLPSSTRNSITIRGGDGDFDFVSSRPLTSKSSKR